MYKRQVCCVCVCVCVCVCADDAAIMTSVVHDCAALDVIGAAHRPRVTQYSPKLLAAAK